MSAFILIRFRKIKLGKNNHGGARLNAGRKPKKAAAAAPSKTSTSSNDSSSTDTDWESVDDADHFDAEKEDMPIDPGVVTSEPPLIVPCDATEGDSDQISPDDFLSDVSSDSPDETFVDHGDCVQDEGGLGDDEEVPISFFLPQLIL